MKRLEELQERIDAITARLESYAPLVQALIDERAAEKAESASHLSNDRSRIHTIRDQMKFAAFNQCKCVRDGDRDGAEAWCGYGQALQWTLEMVFGVKP